MDPFKLVGWQDHASSRGEAAGFAAQDERFSPQHAVVPPGQDKHRNGCVALASTAVTPFTQLQAAAVQGAPTR